MPVELTVMTAIMYGWAVWVHPDDGMTEPVALLSWVSSETTVDGCIVDGSISDDEVPWA